MSDHYKSNNNNDNANEDDGDGNDNGSCCYESFFSLKLLLHQ